MRNKLIASVCAVALASAVSAQVLYWQVNPTVNIGGDASASGSTWNYAALYAVKDGTSQQLDSYMFNSDGTTVQSTYVGKDYMGGEYPAYADFGGTDYAGYSFFIELVNKVDGDSTSTITSIARSGRVSYGELGTALAASVEFDAQWSSINALGSGLTFTALPEPTSGLMLLVGAAMLGLRRNRPQV